VGTRDIHTTREERKMNVIEKGKNGPTSSDDIKQSGMNEGELTKTIEEYTAAIPSSTYLAVAVGAIGLSLAAQLMGRGKWGNFIAQWVPTWLILGLYNKVVKVQGHG
jgi:hypothetical protein